MNQSTKKLLEEVGYNYPEYATLAQKLVIVLATKIANYATNNNELKTAQEITARFLKADEPVSAAPITVE
jgi:hypothetical protein